MKSSNFLKLSLLALLINFTHEGFSQGIKYTRKDSAGINIYTDTISFIIHNDMARYFSGSFWAGIEIPVKNKSSISISGIGTYGNPNFDSDHLYTGWGIEFQYRNYLGKKGRIAKTPVYFAPHIIYRNLKHTDWERFDNGIQGNNYKILYTAEQVQQNNLHIQNFQVFYGGIVIGCELFASDMFTLDMFLGGGIRVAKLKSNEFDGKEIYPFEKGYAMTDLRYNGVVPRIGIRIGIINR